jgi:hypothetical protein
LQVSTQDYVPLTLDDQFVGLTCRYVEDCQVPCPCCYSLA